MSSDLMAAKSSIQPLDFHKPRRPGLTSFRLLHRWWSEACQRVNESWETLLVQSVQLSSESIETINWLAAVELFPAASLAFSFRLGESEIPVLFLLSGRQIRGLLADLLNQSGTEWPELKSVSPAEASMLNVLCEQLARALGAAWPGESEINCQFIEVVDRPQRMRLFAPRLSLLMGRLAVTSRFGVDEALWLLPKEPIEQLVADQIEPSTVQDQLSVRNLKHLTQRLPVEVAVHLGETTLSVTQIAELAVGDVLILNQSPFDDLLATVQGKEKWRGRPVSLGHRLGFSITDLIEN